MDDTGVAGWYQYDSKQGTYQRLNEEAVVSDDGSENYDTLLESYNSLSERYKTTKASDRRIIAVLIFVSVVLSKDGKGGWKQSQIKYSTLSQDTIRFHFWVEERQKLTTWEKQS